MRTLGAPPARHLRSVLRACRARAAAVPPRSRAGKPSTGRARRRLLSVVGIATAALALPLAVASPASAVTHDEAVYWLYIADIPVVSTGNCPFRDNPRCTSLDGLQPHALSGILNLKDAVGRGCRFAITGGTETGHAGGARSHGTGWKLDISHLGCVDNYIRGTFRQVPPSFGISQYVSPAGNVYTDEGNHWDILFNNCGGTC